MKARKAYGKEKGDGRGEGEPSCRRRCWGAMVEGDVNKRVLRGVAGQGRYEDRQNRNKLLHESGGYKRTWRLTIRLLKVLLSRGATAAAFEFKGARVRGPDQIRAPHARYMLANSKPGAAATA
eukprot:6185046-Pleurochrysis_carterae.AAC.3